MGISRDSRHKRRATGGRKANLKKKRQYESGRPAAMTKLGATTIHELRVRGGNKKFRAMRLDHGTFRYLGPYLSRFSPILLSLNVPLCLVLFSSWVFCCVMYLSISYIYIYIYIFPCGCGWLGLSLRSHLFYVALIVVIDRFTFL